MEAELATSAIIAGYWQATAVIIGVVVLAVGAFSLVSLWAGRHIDAKFDKHAAVMAAVMEEFRKDLEAHRRELEEHRKEVEAHLEVHRREVEAHHKEVEAHLEVHRREVEAHHKEVEAAIARGTKEHEDWRVEMKAINEKVTDLLIEREVERRLQASRGGAAGSDGANA